MFKITSKDKLDELSGSNSSLDSVGVDMETEIKLSARNRQRCCVCDFF